MTTQGEREQGAATSGGVISSTPEEMALLSLELRDAIVRRDESNIIVLIGVGADPSVSYTPADKKREWLLPFTPAWSLVSEGASDLMKLVLGENLKTIPLAVNDGSGNGMNLFEMLAERVGDKGIDILHSATQLLSCLAEDAPGRGEGLWRIVDKLLTPRGESLPVVWDSTYAGILLGQGAALPGPDACISLLGRMIAGNSGALPFARMLTVNDRDGAILQRMLDAEMSPNAMIRGVPLLHHLAAGDHERAVEILIGAGVDALATCEAGDLVASCAEAYGNKNLVGTYTAADLARHLGAHGAARMLQAHLAQNRVEDVIKRAASRRSPSA